MAIKGQIAVEEYKYLCSAILSHQKAYLILENLTFGGVIVVYGILFGLIGSAETSKVPWFVWWGLFVLISVSCVRCFGHYIVIRYIASFIAGIENRVLTLESKFGFQRFLDSKKILFIPSRDVFLAVNSLSWMLIVLFSLVVAFKYGGNLPATIFSRLRGLYGQ